MCEPDVCYGTNKIFLQQVFINFPNMATIFLQLKYTWRHMRDRPEQMPRYTVAVVHTMGWGAIFCNVGGTLPWLSVYFAVQSVLLQLFR